MYTLEPARLTPLASWEMSQPLKTEAFETTSTGFTNHTFICNVTYRHPIYDPY